MKINILILNVGRRVELVKCFKNAAKKLEIDSDIIGADCSDTAPALYFADRICLLPKISEPDYINSITETCNRENVSLVVPTIDTDLLLLAENRSHIEDNSKAKILISDKQVIEICRNKINTQSFLEKNHFGVPHLYINEEIQFNNIHYPVFVKPQNGSSSINAFKVNNADELKMYVNIIKQPMIQDYIQGDEYTVDVFLDFDSNVITVVPRLRISVRSGEILKGKISRDKDIISDIIRMMNLLKPIGHVTVQCMKTKDGIQYIEVNPRFGGGAPMSIYSGADSCENLYRLLRREKLVYNENYRDNLTFLRFDESICLDENMNIISEIW